MKPESKSAYPSGHVSRRRVNTRDPGSDYFIVSHSDAKDPGLTKREYAAIKIMAGLAADFQLESSISETADIAINWADALLSKLEETSK